MKQNKIKKGNGKKDFVDIIVCCYNNKSIIGACLESIKKQSYKKYNCILVDDASTDGTSDFVKKKFPWVKIIKREKNNGPSINRNIGIAASHDEYIVTMDSDIVLEKNWLEKQVKFIKQNDNAGICGSLLVYYDNHEKVNSAGGGISKIGIGYDAGSGDNVKKHNKIKKMPYVCSAAMIMKRSMIEKIGNFDETYFYGNEDTDLGWRANIAGYDVLYNPDAVAYHRVSETMKSQSPKVYYYATKNRIRSLLKNYQFRTLLIYFPLFKLISLGDIILRSHRIPKIKAWFWSITHLKDTLNERKKVQSLRKVSDKELFKQFKPRLI